MNGYSVEGKEEQTPCKTQVGATKGIKSIYEIYYRIHFPSLAR